MQYAGGKHRLSKWISGHVHSFGLPIIEPFCGMLNVTVPMQPIYASDASRPVIDLIQAIRNGWMPPDYVSEEDYKKAKRGGGPMEAFCGFGCSWGGKFFGGYARDSRRGGVNFASVAKRGILEKIKKTIDVDISCKSYKDTDLDLGCTIYCDPPYSGTLNAYSVQGFCHDEFWAWCRLARSKGNYVIVSEFSAPDDIEVLDKVPSKTIMNSTSGPVGTVEKLFILRPS